MQTKMTHQGFIGCFLLLVVAIFKGATADSYTVGEDLGWTIPPGGSVAYSNWANTKNFQIGDTIVFKWSGPHRVAEVSEADYSSCSKSNPLFFYDSSPARVTLTSNLTRYFICTEDNHCSDLGQKVTIRIGGTPTYPSGNNNNNNYNNNNYDGDDDDHHWWDWNSSSSLAVNIASLLSAILCSTIVIFFFSY